MHDKYAYIDAMQRGKEGIGEAPLPEAADAIGDLQTRIAAAVGRLGTANAALANLTTNITPVSTIQAVLDRLTEAGGKFEGVAAADKSDLAATCAAKTETAAATVREAMEAMVDIITGVRGVCGQVTEVTEAANRAITGLPEAEQSMVSMGPVAQQVQDTAQRYIDVRGVS